MGSVQRIAEVVARAIIEGNFEERFPKEQFRDYFPKKGCLHCTTGKGKSWSVKEASSYDTYPELVKMLREDPRCYECLSRLSRFLGEFREEEAPSSPTPAVVVPPTSPASSSGASRDWGGYLKRPGVWAGLLVVLGVLMFWGDAANLVIWLGFWGLVAFFVRPKLRGMPKIHPLLLFGVGGCLGIMSLPVLVLVGVLSIAILTGGPSG